MSQSDLVEKLYLFDDRLFAGLNIPTISRWENGLNQPSYAKIRGIMAYFQSQMGRVLPCIEANDVDEAEAIICEEKIEELFRPNQMVTKLPLRHDGEVPFEVVTFRHHPRAGKLLKLHAMLHRSANTPLTRVDTEKFARWMEHPGNLFVAVTFEENLLGLLFTLRLKPESFERILRFELKKNDLQEKDFAQMDERADIYLLSFFALSSDVATLLFRRFYASVIAMQERIGHVGMITSYPEAKRLGIDLGLQEAGKIEDEGKTVVAYRASVEAFMLSDTALRTLFPKGGCR
jgi:transcriptional regulator with XRE-family HTH domain